MGVGRALSLNPSRAGLNWLVTRNATESLHGRPRALVNHNPERSWELHPRGARFVIEQDPQALSGGLGDSVEPPVSTRSWPSTSSTREWGAETIEEHGEGVGGTCAGSGGVLGGGYEKRCIGHQPEQ